MLNIIKTKIQIRDCFKAKIKQQLVKKSIDQYSQQISNNLLQLNIWKTGDIVACYYPLANELSTAQFQKKMKNISTFVFPKINKITGKMIFVEADMHKKQQWEKGLYGINEPISNKQVLLNNIDVFLVPALAFDREGRRLGKGKGFYDRVLFKNKGFKIGLAGSYQISQQALPEEEHDIKMDAILTNNFFLIPFTNRSN